ncbi:tetratricopeptide repeat protein [Sulfoacidibacillus thermotolerans]|uniref:Uncharacterized protein n=1 Tax=Sulfoacidibacillus thermotolerans TaxID=1765684 RepID=A0A2U3D715_SULT2|nr:tetratricopeptide repeat protein [Sulfoacidibacillus thermotolerans]PWI57074.1 hypothetical protein BM613_10515 [Sulfoacidibacillus thermotolerans]
MLFHKSFERLHRAVERIAQQLAQADSEQRGYLLQELEALRELAHPFLEMWLKLEDQLDALYEQYAPDHHEKIDTTPMIAAEIGTTLSSDQGYQLFRKGLGYFDLLMFPESIREFKEIVESDPDMVIARLYLAISYLATGHYEEAQSHLNIVQKSAKDKLLQAAVHDARAQLWILKNQPAKAMQELSAVLAINPNYSDAQFNYAVCSYLLGDYKQAQASAQKALVTEPKDGDLWRIYGAAQFAQGNLLQALKAYQNASTWLPTNSYIATEMAIILLHLGRLKEADALLREIERRGHHFAHYYGAKGELALRLGHTQEAVAFFKKQACLTRTNLSLERLAWALYADKRFDEAAHYFERHVELFGYSLQATVGLARIASLRGQMAAARSYLRRIIRAKQDKVRALGLAELGRMYLEQGDIERAKRYLHCSLRIDRSQESTLVFLGIAMHQGALHETQPSDLQTLTEVTPSFGIDSISLLSDTEATT